MVTGFLKQNGHTYYMTPSTGAMATGLQKISKKTYFFDTKGRMQTGIVNIGSKTCYFNASGIRKLGLITYNGKKYYFNKKTADMVTGWKTVSKKTYYFRASGTDKGAAVTGWMTLNGKTYYFNNSGVMQKGWLTIGTRKYYMDPKTGAMTTGTVTISGTKYNFGKDGYITVSASDLLSTRVKNMVGSGSGKVVLVNRGTCVVTVYSGGKPVKLRIRQGRSCQQRYLRHYCVFRWKACQGHVLLTGQKQVSQFRNERYAARHKVHQG